MTEKPPVVHIGENSPERVAYTLMRHVIKAENISPDQIDRDLILDIYAECLIAVREPERRLPNGSDDTD